MDAKQRLKEIAEYIRIGRDNPELAKLASRAVMAVLDSYEESDHPRGGDPENSGRFSKGNGGGGIPTKEFDKVLGEEFKDYTGKGQTAIDKVFLEQKGHVKAAFTRKQVGTIDIFWGTESEGLKHIIKRRTEDEQNAKKLLAEIGDVLAHGKEVYNKSRDSWEIIRGNKKAIIKPYEKGKKNGWMLTAYEV